MSLHPETLRIRQQHCAWIDGSLAANAEYLATCKVVVGEKILAEKTFDLPKYDSFGTHLPRIYSTDGYSFGFSLPFNHNFSKAAVGKGKPQSNGTAFQYSVQADISKSSIAVADIETNVVVTCERQ